MASEYLTTAEAAKLLKVSASTVQKLAREGSLAAFRVGKQWRFPRQSPDILLYKQKQAAQAGAHGKLKVKTNWKQRSGWGELLKIAAEVGISFERSTP
jgi:excisionase family DNA binding protein